MAAIEKVKIIVVGDSGKYNKDNIIFIVHFCGILIFANIFDFITNKFNKILGNYYNKNIFLLLNHNSFLSFPKAFIILKYFGYV